MLFCAFDEIFHNSSSVKAGLDFAICFTFTQHFICRKYFDKYFVDERDEQGFTNG